MKTYIFLSKSKVEMLFGQVPTKQRETISAELGFNFGVMSGKISSKIPDIESASNQAEIVTSILRKEQKVGQLGADRPWVADSLICKSVQLSQNPHVFLLSGVVREESVLLAGSAGNLVSGVPTSGVQLGYSYLPYLAKALQSSLEEFDKTAIERGPPSMPAVRPHELADVIHRIVREAEGVEMAVDFFGRQLFSGKSLYGPTTRLISPLFVALSDA